MIMVRKLGKDKILNQLIEAANKTWNRKEVEKMRTAFERMAEAIWKVEEFQLEPEEEPAYPTTIFNQMRLRKNESN